MNRNHRLLYIIVLVVNLIMSGLFINIAFAGLSVDPVTVEMLIPKGEEKMGVFKIRNTGENMLRVAVSPEQWLDRTREIKSWLTLEPMELTLNSGETKEIKYRVMPPIDSNGELTCMVFFVAEEVGENRSMVGIRFGVPIYAAVGGTEIIDVEIGNIFLRYDLDNKILNGTISIDNKSNIHIRPIVDIAISDSKDKQITGFSIPYGQPAQAGQNRPFVFQQNVGLKEGKYKLFAKVDYGNLFGLRDKVVEKKTSFVVRVSKAEITEEKKDEKVKE